MFFTLSDNYLNNFSIKFHRGIFFFATYTLEWQY